MRRMLRLPLLQGLLLEGGAVDACRESCVKGGQPSMQGTCLQEWQPPYAGDHARRRATVPCRGSARTTRAYSVWNRTLVCAVLLYAAPCSGAPVRSSIVRKLPLRGTAQFLCGYPRLKLQIACAAKRHGRSRIAGPPADSLALDHAPSPSCPAFAPYSRRQGRIVNFRTDLCKNKRKSE